VLLEFDTYRFGTLTLAEQPLTMEKIESKRLT